MRGPVSPISDIVVAVKQLDALHMLHLAETSVH